MCPRNLPRRMSCYQSSCFLRESSFSTLLKRESGNKCCLATVVARMSIILQGNYLVHGQVSMSIDSINLAEMDFTVPFLCDI